MATVAEAMALFNVVPSPSAPITHLPVVLAPGVDGAVANSNLSPSSSLAFEIGGTMHVVVNAVMNAGDGISSGKMFGTSVHGETFSLEGFFQSSNAMSKLGGLRVIGAEVLDFAL